LLTEYDSRQLFLLAKQIEGFEEGALTLDGLIQRSEALLAAL
jgi:hypothetical protein